MHIKGHYIHRIVCSGSSNELFTLFVEWVDGGPGTSTWEGKEFTYSWILILIALVGWMKPPHYQGMRTKISIVCRGAGYKKLWALNDKERKTNINTQFYIYLDVLRVEAINISHLTEEAITEVSKNCKAVDRASRHIYSGTWRPREAVVDEAVQT